MPPGVVYDDLPGLCPLSMGAEFIYKLEAWTKLILLLQLMVDNENDDQQRRPTD
jgi:hypothetical protein